MNWAYLVIVLWMVGLLVVALMHDHDLRKGLQELETRNAELERRMRNMLEYMLQMNKNEVEMIKNVQEMGKAFKVIESQNYVEILNLRDDIREYSKSVEEQMESVGEAQMKVIKAVENLEKDFGEAAIDMNDSITKSMNPTCTEEIPLKCTCFGPEKLGDFDDGNHAIDPSKQ